MIRSASISIVLLLAALYGVARVAMLCFIRVNRTANRFLAALVVALALCTLPGVAGDAFPWLAYLRWTPALAIGPLLYLHVASQHAAPPRYWTLHLAPAPLGLAWGAAMFFQSAALDSRAVSGAALISLIIYWTLARRIAADSGWTRKLLIASGLALLALIALAAAEWTAAGVSDAGRPGLYLLLAVVAGYLGAEGYRLGMTACLIPPPVEPAAAPPGAPAPPTQAELGERWRAMVLEGRWWRDPELTLAALARRLGTNTTALSRAMNEGLGLNFNEMINRMRVDAVVTALQQAADDQAILEIALAEGFNSKASFNRAFKLYTGKTPSDYRRPRTSQVQASDSA